MLQSPFFSPRRLQPQKAIWLTGRHLQGPPQWAGSVLPECPDFPPVAMPSSLANSQMVWDMLNAMLEQEKRSDALEDWPLPPLPPQFDAHARARQVDFIISLASSLALRSGTAHLACSIFDKYLTLQQMPIAPGHIKVVATTCLKISDSFAEQSNEYYKQENAATYATTAGSITPLQILRCEKEMLPKLRFKLHQPTILWFLQCFMVYAKLSIGDDVGKAASFIADLMLLDFEMHVYPPSLKAHCAILMAAFWVQDGKSYHSEQSVSVSAFSGKLSLLEHWDNQIRNKICRASWETAEGCLHTAVRMLLDKRPEWAGRLRLKAVETKHAQILNRIPIPGAFSSRSSFLKLVRYIVPDSSRHLVPEGQTQSQHN